MMKLSTKLFLSFIFTLLYFPCFSQSTQLKILKEKAKLGDEEAQFQLGKLYSEGIDGKKNYEKAFKYFDLSSRQGYDSAQFCLAEFYELSRGTVQNLNTALSLYRYASNTHALAAYKAGYFYENGIGTQKNIPESTSFYARSCKLGYATACNFIDKKAFINEDDNNISFLENCAKKKDPICQYKLAKAYERLDPPKTTKAFDLYEMASDAKEPNASYELAKFYAEGVLVKKNKVKAAQLYLFAYAKGVSDSKEKIDNYQLDINNMIDDNNEYKNYYLANNGDTEAQYEYALSYMHGKQLNNKECDTLRFFLQRAAIKNHVGAMMLLGNLHENGECFVKSYENAFTWYKKASFLGNDSALYLLGNMHLLGNGTIKSESQAVKMFLRASNRGNKKAEKRLTEFDILRFVDKNDYEYVLYKARNGELIAQQKLAKYFLMTKNPSEGIYWLDRAAQQDPNLYLELGEIYEKGLNGIPVNKMIAQKHYQSAVDNDVTEGHLFLSNLYADNESDNSKATHHLEEYKKNTGRNNQVTKDPESYVKSADLYMKTKNYGKAIDNLSYYIRKFPNPEERPLDIINAFIKRGEAHYELKRFQMSLLDFKNATYLLEENKEHKTLKKDEQKINMICLLYKARIAKSKKEKYKAVLYFKEAEELGAKLTIEEKEYINNIE